MKKNLIFLILSLYVAVLILLGINRFFSSFERDTVGIACNGSYPGKMRHTPRKILFKIDAVDRATLSLYADTRPLTGGSRVVIYLSDNPFNKTYALFVYRDEWTLRKQSKPGLYDIEIGTGKVRGLKLFSKEGLTFALDYALMPTGVLSCENHHLGQKRRDQAKSKELLYACSRRD